MICSSGFVLPESIHKPKLKNTQTGGCDMITQKKEDHKRVGEAYKKPELNCYGNIASVTGSAPGSGPDTKGGLMSGVPKPPK